ncbi:peptidoglycan DD-metalloendopeptidase family protein [bacterium]|nr:peptidoglycan DD-metalloendopeptidase family protein [bacterium]
MEIGEDVMDKKTTTRLIATIIISTVLSALFLALPEGVTNAYATSYESKLNSIRQKKKNIESDIRGLRSEKGDLSGEIKIIDKDLLVAEEELETVERDLEKQEAEQERLGIEMEEKTSDLEKKRGQLSERSAEIYMQGDLTYIDLIIGAQDFGDFINRVFFLQIIFENDRTLIQSVKDGIATVHLQQVAVNQKINEIKEIKAEIEQRIEGIKILKETKDDALKVIEKDLQLFEKSIKELESESKRIQSEIRRIQSANGGYDGKAWTSNFIKPVAGRITSGFGYRIHPIYKRRKFHTGIDIGAPYGTPIKAGGDGKVIFADWRGGYGKCVIIDHGNKIATLYGHMSKILVSKGQNVKAGSIIGKIGSTGLSTGPHLHFEVRVNGKPVNPMGKL